LEDLDFALDLAQNFKDMKGKLVDFNREPRKVGMKINETKAMHINNNNNKRFFLYIEKK
jgi:hypothetical protein